jgi:hypothetical protein
MRKFIITEQEKKDILNLYIKKNILKEDDPMDDDPMDDENIDLKDGPFGLKYNEDGDATNANEIFSADFKSFSVYSGETQGSFQIIFDLKKNFPFGYYSRFDNISESNSGEAKNNITKIVNGTLASSDVTLTKLPKFDELFNAYKEKKITNYKSITSKNYYNYRGDNKLNCMLYLKPINEDDSKVRYILIDSESEYVQVVMENSKNFNSTNYSLTADTEGKTILEFGELADNLEGGPFFTKTSDRADAGDSLTDLVTSSDDADGKYIKMGDKGIEAIKETQKILINLGYGDTYNITNDKEGCKDDVSKCDGNFGRSTRDAVIKFQADNDLKQDGIVGASTAQSLLNYRDDTYTEDV